MPGNIEKLIMECHPHLTQRHQNLLIISTPSEQNELNGKRTIGARDGVSNPCVVAGQKPVRLCGVPALA